MTARLHAGGSDLTDKAKYYLEIEGIGDLGTGDVFHVPENAVITYRAACSCTGTPFYGPWLTTSFGAGLQTLDVEYSSITVRLYNGQTQLPDKTKYYLEIQGIGKNGYDEVFNAPADSDIAYRAWTGTSISGPWVVVSFGSGSHILYYEYASVKYVFDLSGGTCTLQTQVTGIGAVANGAKIHVPKDTAVSFRADICGWLSSVKTMTFKQGEGTVRWSLTAAYTQP